MCLSYTDGIETATKAHLDFSSQALRTDYCSSVKVIVVLQRRRRDCVTVKEPGRGDPLTH